MNPFSGATWLWRALRGQSVVFAALFALTLLGLSVVRVLQHLLAAAGAPWLLLLILPALIFGFLAKREEEWVPDPLVRKRWSRRLVFGSIAVAIAISFLKPRPAAVSEEVPTNRTPLQHHGPSGK
ncbi:MAG TPA: hypothetical protein VFT72_02820 [Opitutaceae bacterium]|nr:hypothetical protein [Opitutaceae bacterium]